jgi:hypothetical protein
MTHVSSCSDWGTIWRLHLKVGENIPNVVTAGQSLDFSLRSWSLCCAYEGSDLYYRLLL